MNRLLIYSATLFLIVLGFALNQEWFNETKLPSNPSAIDTSSVVREASSPEISPSTLTSKSLLNSQILKSSDSSLDRTAKSSPDMQALSSLASHEKKSHYENSPNDEQPADVDAFLSSPNEKVTDMPQSVDDRVVGRKIAISESILADCKKAIELRGDGTPCARFMPFLERMSQEPRDQKWASEMEALLRDYILTDPAKLTIRSLECRQSSCTAELVSSYGRLDNGERWTKNNALWDALYPDTGYIGYEPDPSGNGAIYGTKIYVTVEIFERRN